MIHAKLLELRKGDLVSCGGKEEWRDVPFAVPKELNQKLANALAKARPSPPLWPRRLCLSTRTKFAQPDGKPAFRTLVHVKATVRIMAPDGSYIDMVGSGHGGDGDDKAGGKASTYAWKRRHSLRDSLSLTKI